VEMLSSLTKEIGRLRAENRVEVLNYRRPVFNVNILRLLVYSNVQAAEENHHHRYVTSDPRVSLADYNEGVWRVAEQFYRARRSAVPVSSGHGLNSV
jgi:hypothetical protein